MKKILILLSFFYSFVFCEIYEYVPNVCIDSSTSSGFTSANITVSANSLISCNASGHYCYNKNGWFYEWTNRSFVPCPPPPSTESPEDVMDTLSVTANTTKVIFRDGATMLLFRDGSAVTVDVNGLAIPNRSNNGITPPLAVFDKANAFIPNSNKKFNDIIIDGVPVFIANDNSVGFHGSNFLKSLDF